MAIETTYTQARARLASLLDKVSQDNEVVIIRRRGAEDVALLSARELAGLEETAHLLSSPRNAERLRAALAKARERSVTPMTLDQLKREVGLAEAE